MTIPRFTADKSLYRTSGRYTAAHAERSEAGVQAARMTAQWCYWRDSQCTQFCAGAHPDYRYDCFAICDQHLDHCLDKGTWKMKAAAFQPA
jgi:hypothetical protein